MKSQNSLDRRTFLAIQLLSWRPMNEETIGLIACFETKLTLEPFHMLWILLAPLAKRLGGDG